MALGIAAAGALGCGGGDALALDVDVRDTKPDALDVVVKTLPGAELRFEGQTKTAGDRAGDVFSVKKSALKVGKNTFTVEATAGVLFSKKSASKSATWEADAKSLVRFRAPANVADAEGTFACEGVMCGTGTFRATKAGKLPLDVESAVAASITVEGQKVQLAPGKPSSVEIDLTPRLATAAAAPSDRLALSVVLEAQGAKSADVLSLTGGALADIASRRFAEIERGPVTFAGEATGGEPADALVVVGYPGAKLLAVGKPGKVQDVDFVAVAKPAERFFGCGKTQADGTGILYTDLEVKVYDRRTAAVVTTKKLLADRVPCPPASSGQTKVKSDVREDDVRKVLAEVLKK
jgi:hypothetical protein